MKTVFTMNKAFSFSSQKVKLHLYTSFVLPILTYASEVWNPIMAKDSYMMEKVQRLATKHFILRNYSDSYDCRLVKCGLPSLRTYRKIKDLVYIYKLGHDMGGNLNLNSLKFSHSQFKHHSNDLLEKSYSSNWQHQEFSYRNILTWNNLIKEAKQASSLKLFRNALSTLCFDNYT